MQAVKVSVSQGGVCHDVVGHFEWPGDPVLRVSEGETILAYHPLLNRPVRLVNVEQFPHGWIADVAA